MDPLLGHHTSHEEDEVFTKRPSKPHLGLFARVEMLRRARRMEDRRVDPPGDDPNLGRTDAQTFVEILKGTRDEHQGVALGSERPKEGGRSVERRVEGVDRR